MSREETYKALTLEDLLIEAEESERDGESLSPELLAELFLSEI